MYTIMAHGVILSTVPVRSTGNPPVCLVQYNLPEYSLRRKHQINVPRGLQVIAMHPLLTHYVVGVFLSLLLCTKQQIHTKYCGCLGWYCE